MIVAVLRFEFFSSYEAMFEYMINHGLGALAGDSLQTLQELFWQLIRRHVSSKKNSAFLRLLRTLQVACEASVTTRAKGKAIQRSWRLGPRA